LVAPTSLYGASKAMAELPVRIHARSQGLEAIVLRNFTTTLMRGDLGFEPSTELDTGLHEQVTWHLARRRAVGVK